MILKNHLTVATIVERKNKFLCVWEKSENKLVFNQPAGHVEPGENVIEAAARETLEETGSIVEIKRFLGFYKSIANSSGIAYYRLVFIGNIIDIIPDFQLDTAIQKVDWMTLSQINDFSNVPRSEMTRKSFNDYKTKKTYPLTLFIDN